MKTKTKTAEELELHRLYLMGAAKRLADLMYEWNVMDLPELVVEDSRKGTAYHHVTSALGRVLIDLGVTNPNSKMDFYEMVTTGPMSPMEAIERIREISGPYEGEGGL